jgi:hypothetical protein
MAQDNEAFLSRWSRLKREQAAEEKKPVVTETPAPVLPPVDKLTPESDFTGFMHPKVKDELRRVALKKLFSDPHFNTPDPFEPFSGDWRITEAISPEMLATLNQTRTLLLPQEEEAKREQAALEKEQQVEVQTEVHEGEAKQDEPGRKDT